MPASVDDEHPAQRGEVIPAGRAELIPPAAELEKYEELVPGAAKIILGAFEAQGKHRREQEGRIVAANISEVRTGQWFALIFSLGAFILTGYCAYVGQPWPATVVGGGVIATVVYTFVKGRKP